MAEPRFKLKSSDSKSLVFANMSGCLGRAGFESQPVLIRWVRIFSYCCAQLLGSKKEEQRHFKHICKEDPCCTHKVTSSATVTTSIWKQRTVKARLERFLSVKILYAVTTENNKGPKEKISGSSHSEPQSLFQTVD